MTIADRIDQYFIELGLDPYAARQVSEGLREELNRLREERDELKRLEKEKHSLLEALMDMVNQHFMHKSDDHQDDDFAVVFHSCMSSDEGAIHVLEELGYATPEEGGRGWRLEWSKLCAEPPEGA